MGPSFMQAAWNWGALVPKALREGRLEGPARLAAAFLLGAAVMGTACIFVVRRAKRAAYAQGVAAGAASAEARLAESADAGGPAAPSRQAADTLPPPPPVWRVANLAEDGTVSLAQGEVGHRTLLAALSSQGLARAEVFRLVKAFNGVKNLDHTAPKDTFAFAKAKEGGKLVAFEYQTSPLDVWQARETDGALEAKKLELPIVQKHVAVGVAVADDLRESILGVGLDDDIMPMLDDALEGHAELSDLRSGARLRILATEDVVDGTFVRYASLDAVEYVPANPSTPKLRVYWFPLAPPSGAHAKAGGYYDARGQQPYHGGWRSPVPLARIASRFNPHRMHPVLHVVMPHNGVDFAAPPGTPVYAAAAGVVKSVGDGGPCGNMVQLQHAGGMVSVYCHLSRFAPGLHGGEHVDQRQLVGYVGQTGRTTGPHLHFGIKKGGEVFIDPLALKLDGVRVLPPSLRDEFERERVDKDLALEAIPLPAALPTAPAPDAGAEDTVFDDSPGLE